MTAHIARVRPRPCLISMFTHTHTHTPTHMYALFPIPRTYTDVTIYPGSNLNLIIGPNGERSMPANTAPCAP